MQEDLVKDRVITAAQQSIKHCLDILAPLCTIDNKCESDTKCVSDNRLKEGQVQFYQFMVSIYQVMYKNPEDYMVFPAPYEKYMSERKTDQLKKGKEKEHATNSRESTLRNTFQQAIQFYANFLYRVGLSSIGIDEETGALILSNEGYTDALNQMSRIHNSKYNEQRYELLSKLGVLITQNGNTVLVLHKTYKEAMRGLQYLCQAPESKYKYMNYLRLDYKNAYTSSPSVEDICMVLPPSEVKVIQKLESALKGMKITAKIRPLRGIVSDFKWKVDYTYKSKSICGFYADNGYFMLCIHFNHFQNITAFAKQLQEEDIDLFLWFKNQFPERLCKCPNNRRVFFAEEPRRICGLSNRAEIVNPTEDDVEKAIYILRKYRKVEEVQRS
ncbi:MAG TPA: hypothetical protein VJY54_04980 [Lachnospiraceae bacterium]|nr:hypothetical protein [Lachnospiraceae bacterium]